MNGADIEALVLSGELFNGPARSSSPRRSPSPDSGWHDDELPSTSSSPTNPSSFINASSANKANQQAHQHESIGMGPGRTGVKGVIRDRDEANAMHEHKRGEEMEELRLKMEKGNLGGKTYLEEERENLLIPHFDNEKVDPLVFTHTPSSTQRNAKFGHLREVGLAGFVGAVEKEEPGVWVVLHLYEASVDRCAVLDDTLAKLARIHGGTKFLRCRARALGFASSSAVTKPKKNSSISRPSRSYHDSDDDEDLHEDEDDAEDTDVDADDVDTDMLPTLLIYRSGQLVHNWVRVDYEIGAERENVLGPEAVGELLEKYHVVPRTRSLFSGGPDTDSDEGNDDELDWGGLDAE